RPLERGWGTRASGVLTGGRGVWSAPGRGVGGAPLDLAPAATEADRLQWLRDHCLRPSGPRKTRNGGRARFTNIATYDYTDESGALLFQVVRRAPKDFRQRRPTGKAGWTWSLRKTRRELYRLPEVRDAVAGRRIVLGVDGEKDAGNRRQLRVRATREPA